MKPIDPDGFERMFRKAIDPWNYRGSPFEAFKRRVLMRACGLRRYGRALELACANGETTRLLARRCLRLLAVDASPTAVAAAGARTADLPAVTTSIATLPAALPRGPFDLVVVSEIAYYLTENDLRLLIDGVGKVLAPGGRVVVVHHLLRFDDAAQVPSRAQATIRRAFDRALRPIFSERHGRFEALAFEASRHRHR